MKTIFVNGTFDILHVGHIQLLNYAKSLGDRLIVAIDTDRRVKSLKGNDRPINSQEERKYLLENIKSVDIVEFFDTDDELKGLILKYEACIMVKGSDYKGKSILGSKLLDVIYYDRTEHSTTNIINRRHLR